LFFFSMFLLQAEMEAARSVALHQLRDPQPDEQRVVLPQWLVVVGVCTHMGCIPVSGGDFGGCVLDLP
jgi:ubiquinol-cytochrome c reductase iron-sulfur subunit